jgi:hypothetical protein
MEEELADRTVVNGANLGRLHPDFPMDPNTDRFERKLRSIMDRVKKATDRMDGVVGQYELMCSEVDLGEARDAMAEVRELMEEVTNGMKDVRPEVVEKCVRQIRASEGELLRIGTRLSGAMPAAAITSTRAPAAPADTAVGDFGCRDKQCLNFNLILMVCYLPNSQSPTPTPVPGGCRGVWCYHEPEPTIRGTHLQ